MLQDLRYGIRMLLQAKGWTAVIVLSLALGIGANTALFSAVNGLLFKTLPVRDPAGLVRIKSLGQNDMGNDFSDYGYSAKTSSGESVHSTFPYAIYLEFLKSNQTMSGILAGAPKGQLNVIVDGRAEIARGYVVSGNFYQTLGVDTILGRTILPEDDQPAAPPVAVISEGYWKSRFGGTAGVLGKQVQVNNTSVTIVGVTPAEFTGIQQPAGTAPDITLPLAADTMLDNPEELRNATYWWLQIMGRLKPGATAEQVRGNLDGVFQASAKAGWASYLATISGEERSSARTRNRTQVPRLYVDSGSHGIYDADTNALRSVTILSAVVGILLLIVCANVANLLLSRATSRQKEIAVRLSMGATRLRLIRQLLTESIILAGAGGLAGLLVGYWSRYLLPAGMNQLPFDWRLLFFVSALTLTTGVVFGIAPALRATGANLNAGLKENARSIVGARTILSRSLLVIQVAMSLVLLIGAGLFLGTLQNLRKVDVGFDPSNLLMFRVSPQLNGYTPTRTAALYAGMIQQLGSVPGVRGVSFSQPPLLSGSISSTDIFIEGHSYEGGPGGQSGSKGDNINQVRVSPSFFQTIGIPLLTGRLFNDHDDANSPTVAIINETAARRYFANENPLGLHFGKQIEKRGQVEIVGVVRDTKYNSIREPAPPTVYFALLQQCCPGAAFEVRTAVNPSEVIASVRDAVRQIGPNLPLMNVTTQTEQIDLRLQQEKLFAQSYGLFGGLALLLASIGMFGLMSYNVSRRTNEIGIRMALGAQRQDVLKLIMRESMLLVAVGVALGLAGALSAGSFVKSILFGLAPTDPLSIAVAIALLTLVSAFAGYLPARRASRVDPMAALHHE